MLVHHNTRPALSVGIEGQAISYEMLSQTVRELPPDGEGANIQVIHGDLREAVPALLAENSFDLITANPPFSKRNSGGHCNDDQRTFARFEMRGGVEDYCMCAAKLLRPGRGRFVLAFWHKEDGLARVQRASSSAGLRVVRRVDVLAGKASNTEPHISIFELDNNFSLGGGDIQTVTLDVRRDESNRLSRTYKEIQERLEMRPRPLKPTIGKMVHGQS